MISIKHCSDSYSYFLLPKKLQLFYVPSGYFSYTYGDYDPPSSEMPTACYVYVFKNERYSFIKDVIVL